GLSRSLGRCCPCSPEEKAYELPQFLRIRLSPGRNCILAATLPKDARVMIQVGEKGLSSLWIDDEFLVLLAISISSKTVLESLAQSGFLLERQTRVGSAPLPLCIPV